MNIMKIGISTAIVAAMGTNIGIVATAVVALKVIATIGVVACKAIENDKFKSPSIKVLK